MDALKWLATLVEPSHLRMGLFGLYAVAGVSKLIPSQQQDMKSKFPLLPDWICSTVAVWELAIVIVYNFIGAKNYALHMSFMVMGGAFYALLSQSTKHPISFARKTYGLGLIPPIATTLATALVCIQENLSLHAAPLSLFIGLCIGGYITKP